MSIDNLTLGEIKQISTLLGGSQESDINAFEVGKCYVIRTVTMINTGRVVAVGKQEILLDEAAWVADTGRYHDFLKSPATMAKEVEPYPVGMRAGVGRGAICDFCQVLETPKSQK